MSRKYLVAKAQDLVFATNIAQVGRDPDAVRGVLETAPLGLCKRVFEDVAYRDMASGCGELFGECPAHTVAAAGDDCQLGCKVLHASILALRRSAALVRRVVGSVAERPSSAPGWTVLANSWLQA